MIVEQSLDTARRAGVRLLTACLWSSTIALAVMGTHLGSDDVWLAVALSVLLNLVPTWCWFKRRIDVHARISFGVAAALHPALYVYLLQDHPWQMDLHMYFFVGLAALTVLYDRKPVMVAANIIVFHHLLFLTTASEWAFSGNADIWRVLMHALLVLLETIVLSILTTRMAALISAQDAARQHSDKLAATAGATAEHARIEQAAAERQLYEREAQFRMVTEQVSDIIVRLDLEDRCTYASPAIRDVTGYSSDEVIGVDVIGAGHPEDREKVRARNTALREGRIDRLAERFRIPHRDGHWLWIEAHSRLVRIGDGAMEVVSVVRDISAQKAMETQLVAERERAEDAARSKTNFLADMSHEIRTPMNGVVGFTDLLLAGELSDDQRRRGEMIADSSRNMVRLLNDILDLSKIEAGQMAVATEPYDLGHALDACAKLVRPAIEQTGVELCCEISDELPQMVMGDGLRLRQIILNLLGNATKFTIEGRITLRAGLVHDVGRPMLSIQVEDTGIGIAHDRQRAVFDEFVQADASTGPRFGGTGLGLSISHRLARLMDGELRIESEVNRGSCFTLILPFAPAEIQPVRPASAGIGTGPDHIIDSALNVLVAEDHDINQCLIADMLDRIGCRHALAEDGCEAVDMVNAAAARGDAYSIILMDMQMPRMGGLEATRHIRSAGFTADELPIVALTANAYADDIAACLDAGMQAHMAKPYSFDDLTFTLGRWAADPIATANRVAIKPGPQDRSQPLKMER